MFDATLEEHGMLNGIQTLAPVQEMVVSEETDSEHGSGSESESESEDEGAVTTRGMKRGIATKALLTRDPNQLRPFEVMAVDNRPMPPLRDKVGDPKPYHGNVVTQLVVYCVSSDAGFVYNLKSKTENPEFMEKFIADMQVDKLPYQCTVITDNCGSFVAPGGTAIGDFTKMLHSKGIRHQPIAAWSPGLRLSLASGRCGD